jgi:hypothetical protein
MSDALCQFFPFYDDTHAEIGQESDLSPIEDNGSL